MFGVVFDCGWFYFWIWVKGKGFPKAVALCSIENKFQKMKNFIELHVRSELEMLAPKSKMDVWYEKNKFKAWLISIIIGLVGLYAKFF